MSPYCLWLDDYRPLPRTTHEWKLAKGINEFKATIEKYGLPQYVSFDHDLNEKHYNGDFSDKLTGLDCVEWLLKYCKDRKLEFPRWSVHTFNRAKGIEMTQLLQVSAGSNKEVASWKDYDGQA